MRSTTFDQALKSSDEIDLATKRFMNASLEMSKEIAGRGINGTDPTAIESEFMEACIQFNLLLVLRNLQKG